MKNETKENEMHSNASIWKAILQDTDKILKGIEKKLLQAKLNKNVPDTDEAIDEFSKNARDYIEKTELLQKRITHFEDNLSLINECDTLECDMDFSDEVKAISIEVKTCKKNVSILASEIGYYTDSKLSE